jgi:TolB-like protein
VVTVTGRGYRFVGPESSTPVSTTEIQQVPSLPDRPSIAVLPFANLNGAPEQEYFADGIVEDIITALSRMRWLFVIARNSSFTYKGRAVDVKQIGRACHAGDAHEYRMTPSSTLPKRKLTISSA